MISRVAVAKMHGARNDFIVMDARARAIDAPSDLARRLCDRRGGVGADGLLLIGPAVGADASMRVINADGSEAEMCGNGIRCVARYLDERGEGGALAIATGAGTIRTNVVDRGETYRVRVDMGTPSMRELVVPFEDAAVVDTGNPHLVLFRERLSDVDVLELGESLQSSPLFPSGVNLHVAVVLDRSRLQVAHYERGAGLTMACGTGAVACAFAAIASGRVVTPVTVRVPGGELFVELDARGRALMTGPAVHVFDTTVPL